MEDMYDVVVVGGGAAGLGGALALARARRSVLVVDAGQPRNAPADRVHNYLTRDGTPPGELLAAGRAEVLRYGGRFRPGRVDGAVRDGDGFRVAIDGGAVVRARRLLLATGVVDELPGVPGIAERWGRDVVHCPYCHGWEVRDRRIGVLATNGLAAHLALLWRQLSDTVVLLRHDAPEPDPGQVERLAARGVAVVHGRVVELVVAGEALTGVRLSTGETVELDALAVAPRVSVHSGLSRSLGLSLVDDSAGTRIAADATGATGVPGVWVAGNAADPRAQVISSAAAGLSAAAALNADLVEEDTDRAVDAYRHTLSTLFDEAGWDERYRARPRLWSGRPNPQLVAEAEALTPGRALDVGTGEGADTLWLARRGWRVTALDISGTALERAAEHVAADGPEVAARVEWTHADLRTWVPEPGRYDLVSAQFMQLPGDARRGAFARLADAVARGGTLLIVGHHPSDLRTSAHRMHFPDMMYTAEEVAESLDPAAFEVLAAQTRPRTVQNPEGAEVTIHDAVLLARRR